VQDDARLPFLGQPRDGILRNLATTNSKSARSEKLRAAEAVRVILQTKYVCNLGARVCSNYCTY